MDRTNNGATESSSRPERDNQQFSDLLQQAWNSIERARFNITATAGAIEELVRHVESGSQANGRLPLQAGVYDSNSGKEFNYLDDRGESPLLQDRK